MPIHLPVMYYLLLSDFTFSVPECGRLTGGIQQSLFSKDVLTPGYILAYRVAVAYDGPQCTPCLMMMMSSACMTDPS